jgi:hypothetical protein
MRLWPQGGQCVGGVAQMIGAIQCTFDEGEGRARN